MKNMVLNTCLCFAIVIAATTITSDTVLQKSTLNSAGSPLKSTAEGKPSVLSRFWAQKMQQPYTFARTEHEEALSALSSSQPGMPSIQQIQGYRSSPAGKAAMVNTLRRIVQERKGGDRDYNKPTESWWNRLSSFTTKVKQTASTFGQKLKEGFLRPGHIREIQHEQKEAALAQEQSLNNARDQWQQIQKERDWGWWVPHLSRTSQQEKEFKAIQGLLQQYDVVSRERPLTSTEQVEIVDATKKITDLAYEPEKRSIISLRDKILGRKPKTVKGKKEILKEEVKEAQELLKEDLQAAKEEQKEKLIDKTLHWAVEKFDLVGYVERRIIEKLKDTPIPEPYYKDVAHALIKETGGVQSSGESNSSYLIRQALSVAGYPETLHEQAEANIAWYIHNLPAELEKYPVLAEEFKKRALPHVPDLEKRLMPMIAQELEKREKQTGGNE